MPPRPAAKRLVLSALSLIACLGLTGSHTARAETAPKEEAPATEPRPLAATLTGAAALDYDAAKLLFSDGDFEGAMVKLESAYAASGDARLLWNEAVCQKNLRHYAKVHKLVERFLSEGGALITARARQEANDLLGALQSLTAPITFAVDVPGANVYVDGELVGLSPLAKPVLVGVGNRHLRVAKAGFVELSQDLVVAGAAAQTITLPLVRERHEGRLITTAGDTDAISIDGKVVAMGRSELTLESGPHSLRVSAPGMRPYQSELFIEDGKTRTIRLSLDPESSSAVVPTWVWIAGSAVVAGGAAVGGYFLFKPKDQVIPAPPGTLVPGGVQFAGVTRF